MLPILIVLGLGVLYVVVMVLLKVRDHRRAPTLASTDYEPLRVSLYERWSALDGVPTLPEPDLIVATRCYLDQVSAEGGLRPHELAAWLDECLDTYEHCDTFRLPAARYNLVRVAKRLLSRPPAPPPKDAA